MIFRVLSADHCTLPLDATIPSHILSVQPPVPFNRRRLTASTYIPFTGSDPVDQVVALKAWLFPHSVSVSAYFVVIFFVMSSFRVWLLVVSVLLVREINAGFAVMERQASASPSPTVGNCSVAPTICYLNTPYPIALQPGLPCDVKEHHYPESESVWLTRLAVQLSMSLK